MASSREDFELYQQKKYEKWLQKKQQASQVIPEGQETTIAEATGEQKAFDDYVQALSSGAIGGYQLDVNKVVNGGWNKYQEGSQGIPTELVGKGAYGVYNTVYENDNNKTGTQVLYSVTANDENLKGIIFTRSVGFESNGSYQQKSPWRRYALFGEAGPAGPAGPQGPVGPAGPAGGGGSLPDINLDQKYKRLETINGSYSMNFFPYREMTNDFGFGMDGKTIYTKTRKQLSSTGNKYSKHYNRIRKGESIHLYYELDPRYTPKGKDHMQLSLKIANVKGGQAEEKDVDLSRANEFLKGNISFKDWGYFTVGIGGEGTPKKFGVEIDAWYGDENLKPTTLGQEFFFKEYNGIPLRACMSTETGTVKDEYIKLPYWDVYSKKVNICNLKDLKHTRIFPESPELENEQILLIECPKDMLPPDSESSQDIKKRAKQLIVNNLCEIESGAGGTDDFADDEENIYFVKDLVKINQKWHFELMCNKQFAYKWRSHLMQTQILYPIKEVITQLPYGGEIWTLDSGEQIYTNNYGTIKTSTDKKTSIILKDSPFGCPDKEILASHIVAKTDYYNRISENYEGPLGPKRDLP